MSIKINNGSVWCLTPFTKSISVISLRQVHLSMLSLISFNQYSAQYSFQTTGCFSSSPYLKYGQRPLEKAQLLLKIDASKKKCRCTVIVYDVMLRKETSNSTGKGLSQPDFCAIVIRCIPGFRLQWKPF